MTEDKKEVELPEGLLVEWNIEMDKDGQKVIILYGIEDENEYAKRKVKPDGYTGKIFVHNRDSGTYSVREARNGAYIQTVFETTYYEEKGDYTREEVIEKVKHLLQQIKENREKVRKSTYSDHGIEFY